MATEYDSKDSYMGSICGRSLNVRHPFGNEAKRIIGFEGEGLAFDGEAAGDMNNIE